MGKMRLTESALHLVQSEHSDSDIRVWAEVHQVLTRTYHVSVINIIFFFLSHCADTRHIAKRWPCIGFHALSSYTTAMPNGGNLCSPASSRRSRWQVRTRRTRYCLALTSTFSVRYIYIYIYNITIYNVNSTYAAATPPLTRTRDALLPAPFHLALLLLSCNNITDRALKSAATSTDISFRLAKRDNVRYLSITIAQVKATGVSR